MKSRFTIAGGYLIALLWTAVGAERTSAALAPSLSPETSGVAPRAVEPQNDGNATARMVSSPLSQWARDRVEVGTRLTYFDFTDNTRPPDPSQRQTFIGYIDQLGAEQNYWPLKLFVDVWLSTHIGVEVTYDGVDARTHNEGTDISDGDVSMAGPILSLLFRYPVGSTLIPYAGLGLAWWNAKFDEAGWWGGGWDSPEAFEAAGGRGLDPGDARRHMNVDGDVAPVITGGLIYHLTDRIDADLLVRYMEITADAEFVRTVHGGVTLARDGEFTLDHVAYGAGLRYRF